MSETLYISMGLQPSHPSLLHSSQPYIKQTILLSALDYS